MDPISIAIVGAAAAKSMDLLVGGILEVAKRSKNAKVSKWRPELTAKEICKEIESHRMVRTILDTENDLDISSFYHPSKASIPSQEKPVKIDQLSSLGDSQAILVEGTIGQGKSVLMRYLVLRELVRGSSVPVLCELRRLEGRRIRELILDEIKNIGLGSELSHVDLILRSGQCTIFLDGFDEIPQDEQHRCVVEIENMIRRSSGLRIVLTSRPGQAIQQSAKVVRVKLRPLEGREYQDVVNRMTDSPKKAKAILDGIKKSSGNINRLLVTPLMCALLVVRHKYEHSIPENESEFFGDLFLVLLRRHDRMKEGWERPRASGLTDRSLRLFFDTFCFVTRRQDRSVFDDESLYGAAEDAASRCGVECSAELAIEDISKVTCLLLEEGGEWRFVHRGVQEYHAASYIKRQLDDKVEKFYVHCSKNWRSWRQELKFLSVIDEHRFVKYFLLSDLVRSLGHAGDPSGFRRRSREDCATLVRDQFGGLQLQCRTAVPGYRSELVRKQWDGVQANWLVKDPRRSVSMSALVSSWYVAEEQMDEDFAYDLFVVSLPLAELHEAGKISWHAITQRLSNSEETVAGYRIEVRELLVDAGTKKALLQIAVPYRDRIYKKIVECKGLLGRQRKHEGDFEF